jgi:hypothetical protein
MDKSFYFTTTNPSDFHGNLVTLLFIAELAVLAAGCLS